MKIPMLLCSLITVVPAAQWQAKVVGVKGCNSLEILHDGKVYEVKLYGIACPARQESFGKQSRRFAADQAFMADVRFEMVGAESDGQLIGKVVLADGRNLGTEMIKSGMAWWDKQATPEDKHLAGLEKAARDAYLGLWAGAEDEEDIDWRKDVLAKRESNEKTAGLLSAAEGN